ncbi:DUF7115 domain-containing protein [Halorientalis litorea]|uniref:DUF7115 domain-containing protein n=1 Tax=Halorientalis litorea TaxID=2931977 RepID=UPI001FF6AF20|nr:hypothetical protein [Halorientalis litorea]
MDVPDLVRDALGGEEIQAGVNLGDEDTVCLTPTRTLLYRAEGLLSDEKVEEFPHDIERLAVSEGRRKTKFTLHYVDDARSFSVPSSRDTQVLELLFRGILRTAGVIEADENIAGAFRFSELAVVVTDARVVRHIGAAVWTDDYQVYPYADLTGLAFERGSVATEVVLEIDGRPQRVKTPNDQARKVQEVIEETAFEYHGVSSLEELNAAVGTDETDAPAEDDDGLGLGSGVEPLVTDADGSSMDEPMEPASRSDTTADTDAHDSRVDGVRQTDAATATGHSSRSAPSEPRDDATENGTTGPTSEDIAAVEERLSELTTAVQRQNELLEEQHDIIEQLVRELREGRG